MVIAAHFDEIAPSEATPRQHRRRLHLEVSGALPSGGDAAVTIHNVSATGLLLETRTMLGEGEKIEIDLPDAGPSAARIVWSSEHFHGAQFETPLTPGVLSALELRSKPPSVPGHGEQSLAQRLHDARKAKGLTLDAVAQQLGVSKPTVWAWEQGRARPSAERFAAIAELFGLGEASLATGRNETALAAAMAQARQQVAAAYGVDPARVRILIEL